jgi:hypothetical protein
LPSGPGFPRAASASGPPLSVLSSSGALPATSETVAALSGTLPAAHAAPAAPANDPQQLLLLWGAGELGRAAVASAVQDNSRLLLSLVPLGLEAAKIEAVAGK